jgi:hypothetical protein
LAKRGGATARLTGFALACFFFRIFGRLPGSASNHGSEAHESELFLRTL